MPTRLRLFLIVLNATLFLVAAAPLLRNWERIGAEHLWTLLVSAAACGVTLTLLLIVATGRLAYRGETGPRS